MLERLEEEAELLPAGIEKTARVLRLPLAWRAMFSSESRRSGRVRKADERPRQRMAALAVLAFVVSASMLAACSGGRAGDRSGSVPPPGPRTNGAGEAPSAAVEVGTPGVEPIRLGLVMASSGLLAQVDSPVIEAFRYAVRQVNESGGLLGRPLELLEYDSNSELNVAYKATLRLLERNVSLIFATCDPFYSRPIMEIAGDEGVLVISPCGPEPEVGGLFVRPLAFSSGTSAENYARVMAEHAVSEGHQAATVFVEIDDEWAVETCDLFSERFAELGGQVTNRVVLDARWWEVAAKISRPKVLEMLADASQSPLLVLCSAIDGRGRDLFRLLRASGVNAPVLATNSLDGREWLNTVPNVGTLLVVTEASMYGDDLSRQVNFYFASTLDAEPGAPERVGRAVTGAEGLWMFIRAVNLTGSLDPVTLARTIEGFSDTELWMGPATFDQDSHVVSGRALRIVSHAGGVSRLIGVRSPAEVTEAPEAEQQPQEAAPEAPEAAPQTPGTAEAFPEGAEQQPVAAQ